MARKTSLAPEDFEGEVGEQFGDGDVGEMVVVAGSDTLVQFTIKGTMPLLLHADNVEWSDELSAERSRTQSQREKDGHTVRRGDDRDPAWTWMGYMYKSLDEKVFTVPNQNLSAAIIIAATRTQKKPRGSYKADAASQIAFDSIDLEFFCDGKQIEVKDIQNLRNEPNFEKHREAAKDLGFKLDMRRAKVGASKHVRVRPRFEKWSISGVIRLHPGPIRAIKGAMDRSDAPTLEDLLNYAGNVGLGDWRPGSPHPGAFGMFKVDEYKILKD